MRKQYWFMPLAVLLIAASGGMYLKSTGKGEAVTAVRVTPTDDPVRASDRQGEADRRIQALRSDPWKTTKCLALDKSSAKLLPGYNVDVHFAINRAVSTLQVPYSAVKQNEDGTSYVWIVEGSRAVRTQVEIGIKNEAFIEVTKGLEEDRLVIVKAPDSLKEGQKVFVNS